MVDPLPLKKAPSAPLFRPRDDARQERNQFLPERLMKIIDEFPTKIS